MSKTAHLRAVPDPGRQAAQQGDVLEVEDAHPLIPDGVYLAFCTGYDVRQVFRTMKMFFHFRITEGDYAGLEVWKPYGVKGCINPGKGPGSGPRPKLHRRSNLFKDLCRILEISPRTKASRISPKELRGKLFRVETRTVICDSKQKPLSSDEQYSVVKEIISIEAG